METCDVSKYERVWILQIFTRFYNILRASRKYERMGTLRWKFVSSSYFILNTWKSAIRLLFLSSRDQQKESMVIYFYFHLKFHQFDNEASLTKSVTFELLTCIEFLYSMCWKSRLKRCVTKENGDASLVERVGDVLSIFTA